MRTLCPLFTYAGDTVTYAARVAELLPGDAAIVTGEHSGPPSTEEPSLPALLAHLIELHDRDVTTLGYVTCGRGARTVDQVLDDIDRWWTLGVPRIFMDEWPEDWGSLRLGRFWGAVRAYAGKGSIDRPIFIANPGRDIPMKAEPGDGCLVVTYESDVLRTMANPRTWEAIILHSQPVGQIGDVRAALARLGYRWSYVTADTMPNPYDGLSGG